MIRKKRGCIKEGHEKKTNYWGEVGSARQEKTQSRSASGSKVMEGKGGEKTALDDGPGRARPTISERKEGTRRDQCREKEFQKPNRQQVTSGSFLKTIASQI